MPDLFSRGDSVPGPGVVHKLTITDDGKVSLLTGDYCRPGYLIQKLEIDHQDMFTKVSSILPGRVDIDFSAIMGKIADALGVPAGELRIQTVMVEATSTGKDKLTVNGVEIPL